MISAGQLLGFALASLVLIVIPGPGVLFIVGRALAHGRRTALTTALGHAAGNYLVATCVAVGLGALLQRSEQAFVIVKVTGALYLIWLGIHAIRHRKSLADAFAVAVAPREGWRALRDGVAVGVTNPKAYILFGAILPQFVNRGAGNVPAQMLLLALVSVSIGALSDCSWAYTASAVRTWFARSPRRFELVGGAGGLAMIGVGVTVAFTGRSRLPGSMHRARSSGRAAISRGIARLAWGAGAQRPYARGPVLCLRAAAPRRTGLLFFLRNFGTDYCGGSGLRG